MATKKAISAGTGRRKTATARVNLVEGSGKWTVNGVALETYLPSEALRDYLRQPVAISGYDMEHVDVVVFAKGGELDAPWVVPLPAAKSRPYAVEAHTASMAAPSFPDAAEVATRTVVGANRNGEMSVQMVLDFPSAIKGGVRAYDYEVRVEQERGGGDVVCRVVSPTYNCGFAHECKEVRAVFSVRKLPHKMPYRIAVYPRNCFGIAGAPIRSQIKKST